MPNRFLLSTLCALCACGVEAETRDPKPPARGTSHALAPVAAAPEKAATARTAVRAFEAEGDPAAVLRTYYGLIAQRRFEDAWQMRSTRDDGRQAFISDLERYERYDATVGSASRPVEAEDGLYVEVPVMIVGRLKDGPAVATGGSVTLRRAGKGNPSHLRQWHIFTR